jgi:acyl-CoA synthetase (AMP-forming)/AMP-acid ligase II
MKTIIGEFWRRADADPNGTFCHFISPQGEQLLTRGGLARLVNGHANALREAGAEPRSVALIFLPHMPHLYAAFLGAMTAGVTPSFMPCPTPKQDPKLYWASHLKLLERVGDCTIVSDSHHIAQMREAGIAGSRIIDVADVQPSDIRNMSAALEPDEIAFLQHSSGTTGLKKGVALTNRVIDAQIGPYAASLSLAPGDMIVSWLPLYHDMGLIACFVLPVMTGTPFVHMDAFHWLSRPSLLLDLAEKHRATLAWLPNFAYEHLVNTAGADANARKLSHMRAIISCSEPCRAPTFERFARTFASAGLSSDKLQCCYAMAETVFAVSQTELGKPSPVKHFDRTQLEPGHIARAVAPSDANAIALLSNGHSIAGLSVVTRDPDGNALPEHAIGELTIRGDCVFGGYYKAPDLTAERMKDGWYWTRDIGFVSGGEVFVLGRNDDVIICNGKNIFAHDVEAEVNAVAGLKPGRNVAVVVNDDRSGTQKFAIIAEPENFENAVLKDAKKAIMARVYNSVGVAPHVIHFVPQGWLVKTTSGKISRKENLKKLMETATS